MKKKIFSALSFLVAIGEIAKIVCEMVSENDTEKADVDLDENQG